jgi:hypothetical protein
VATRSTKLKLGSLQRMKRRGEIPTAFFMRWDGTNEIGIGADCDVEKYNYLSDRVSKPEWAIGQMLGKGPLV